MGETMKPTDLLEDVDIQKRLLIAIEDAGSQRAFAKLCGVSPQYIGQVVKGQERAGDKVLVRLGLERIESVVRMKR